MGRYKKPHDNCCVCGKGSGKYKHVQLFKDNDPSERQRRMLDGTQKKESNDRAAYVDQAAELPWRAGAELPWQVIGLPPQEEGVERKCGSALLSKSSGPSVCVRGISSLRYACNIAVPAWRRLRLHCLARTFFFSTDGLTFFMCY